MLDWRVGVGAVLCCAAAMPAWSLQGEAPTTAFTGADLFALSVASDPQISPDGRQIAYVRQTADVMTDRMRPSIWLIDVDSGRQRPIIAGPGNHTNPRWSPDWRRLAYRPRKGLRRNCSGPIGSADCRGRTPPAIGSNLRLA